MSLLALARTRLAEIEAARGTPRGTAVEHVERRTRIGTATQCFTVPFLGRGTVEQSSTSALVCGRSGAECLERSAIGYRNGLERLASMPVPAGVQARRWAQIVNDAALLEADWGETARALGWSDLALWGCNADPSARRLDRDGLVMRLRGRRVFAITTELAAIRCQGGHSLAYRLRPCPGMVCPAPGTIPLWDLSDVPHSPVSLTADDPRSVAPPRPG